MKLFKEAANVENLSLFSSATAVQSQPKSHTFTVNLAVFAPHPRWRQKPWRGLFSPSIPESTSKNKNLCSTKLINTGRISRRKHVDLNGTLGSLSMRVFETRMATVSELFSFLICLHTTTFTLPSIFSPLDIVSIKSGRHHCPSARNFLFRLPSASQKRACLSSLFA